MVRRQVAWHARGDYVCATLRDGAARSVLVHQLSRRRSQLPFGRAKGLVQCALFHPTRPLLFVAVSTAPLPLPRSRPYPAEGSITYRSLILASKHIFYTKK